MLKAITAPRPDDVLIELAGHGDPAAFYSVFGPMLDATRAAIRASGRSPEQASEETLQLAARLYREFRGVPGGQSAQEWYAGRTRRHIPQSGLNATTQQPSAVETGDGAQFQERLELLLQREYSARNRARRRAGLSATVARPGTWSWPVIAALTVAGLVLLLYAALAISGTGLTVTLTRTGRNVSVSFLSPAAPETAVPAATGPGTAGVRSDSATVVVPAVRPAPAPAARPPAAAQPVQAPAARPVPAAGALDPAAPVVRPRPAADTAARIERTRLTAPAGTPAPAAETPARPVQPPAQRAATPRDTAGSAGVRREWTTAPDAAVTGHSQSSVPAAEAPTAPSGSGGQAEAAE